MSLITERYTANADTSNLLDEPERESLLRTTKLVEDLFHVPIAYMALVGADFTVSTRIGSGQRYWGNLKTLPLPVALAKPIVWPDPSGIATPGFIAGDLRFVAAVPLRSSDGLELGLLVIADVLPRPEFSQKDKETLAELACVLAGKMELRVMACQARETESYLREAENRFRNIANSAPVMIIYSGVDGGSSFVNQAWLEFTGREFAEELGDGYADTFHPDYREGIVQSYWSAFQDRRPVTFEFPMRRHDGEYRWMQTRGTPRFRDDGSFAGYIGCLVDQTEQYAAVADLRQQVLCTKALANAANLCYLILDPEGRIQPGTPGCDLAKMAGQFLWEVCAGDAAARNAVRDAVHRIAGDNPVLRKQIVETQLVRLSQPDARVTDLTWNFTPVRSDRDELIAIMATAVRGTAEAVPRAGCDHLQGFCSLH